MSGATTIDEEIASTATALASLRYRFQDCEWSAATGLINFRMRWCDPITGRWLSKDPIGLSGGLNLYVFCENSSIMALDPIGLLSVIPPNFTRLHPRSSEDIANMALYSARKNIGSGKWLYENGGRLWGGKPKCNKFVSDMYNSARKVIPTGFRGTKPPRAKDWFQGRVPDGFQRTRHPKPGDIATDGQHMGIVSGSNTTISASSFSGGLIVENDWGFRNGNKPGAKEDTRFYTYKGNWIWYEKFGF